MGCAFVHPPSNEELRILMAEDAVPSEEAKQTERRTWVRHPASQAVSCRPIGASTAETVWLGNLVSISLGGMGLLLTRRFEPATLLIVELSDTDKRVHTIGVRVVHATPENNTRWMIGCKTVSPFSEEDLLALA
jgi:c-di-GMP-binding flagellar brake protein YcgR